MRTAHIPTYVQTIQRLLSAGGGHILVLLDLQMVYVIDHTLPQYGQRGDRLHLMDESHCVSKREIEDTRASDAYGDQRAGASDYINDSDGSRTLGVDALAPFGLISRVPCVLLSVGRHERHAHTDATHASLGGPRTLVGSPDAPPHQGGSPIYLHPESYGGSTNNGYFDGVQASSYATFNDDEWTTHPFDPTFNPTPLSMQGSPFEPSPPSNVQITSVPVNDAPSASSPPESSPPLRPVVGQWGQECGLPLDDWGLERSFMPPRTTNAPADNKHSRSIVCLRRTATPQRRSIPIAPLSRHPSVVWPNDYPNNGSQPGKSDAVIMGGRERTLYARATRGAMDQPQVRREELKTEADRGDETSLHLTSRLKKSLPILFNYRIGSIELVWKHWTYWEPHPREAELDTGATSASAGERTGEYVLRPWYQRGIAVALQMGFGGFIGGLLLGTRQRDVRRMFLLPRTWPPAPKAAALPRPSRLPPAAASPEKTEERWLILQSLINMNFTGKGIAVPMNQCDLGKGRDDSELKIKVNGITTPFLVRLDGNSKVCGEKLSVGQARDEIFKWWYGEALGKKLRGSERWKELP
ncbi:uncharacterized protein C8Q71DRAFT_860366 [Rhodofomes roseus]|uniref:Uncharacterized protein n=1 Tax=Rhodofomes roseus TaxID=34475 RepID=A0ABQ8K921_9APHY|nr:uncharacterized protein C8Q71DRAFT_860366 [Rhodofomes roseus]KAH9833583.1 hypothetical protein C8Q71DRAFT_860366 [Rhodofomes roseus]